jgi:hypothetical protein
MILKGKEDRVCYQWIRSAKDQYLVYRQLFCVSHLFVLGFKVRSKLTSILPIVAGAMIATFSQQWVPTDDGSYKRMNKNMLSNDLQVVGNIVANDEE